MAPAKKSAWPWVLAIVALCVLNLGTLGTWSGVCIDFVGEASRLSSCTIEPAVGWSGAWAIAALSMLGVAYAAYWIARRNH